MEMEERFDELQDEYEAGSGRHEVIDRDDEGLD